eukprot:jgi/Psemu1/35618/gm1.35618_g
MDNNNNNKHGIVFFVLRHHHPPPGTLHLVSVSVSRLGEDDDKSGAYRNQLVGQTALVTGANSRTVNPVVLVKWGSSTSTSVNGAAVVTETVDTSSLQSVKDFCDQFIESCKGAPLDMYPQQLAGNTTAILTSLVGRSSGGDHQVTNNLLTTYQQATNKLPTTYQQLTIIVVYQTHSVYELWPASYNAEDRPDQLPASTLKDTNTRAVSLKEETKEPNQGGGSTGFRDPAKQAREKTLDDSAERIAQVGIS